MQLDTKDKQNEKLKSEVIKAQNAERKSITETVMEFKQYLKHMNEVEKQTEKNYEEFLLERIENDKINNQREATDAERVSSLVEDVSKLKFKI